jgi:hypothetical protein
MTIRNERQLDLFASHPRFSPNLDGNPRGLDVADCRRIPHTAQLMQLNTVRPARELYALGRVEVWMRVMISERNSRGISA